MPQITVGDDTFEAPDDRRLVLALEDNGIDILHKCGGYAQCTTCRVEIAEGEPDRMTVAERDKLTEKNLAGQYRLSCQILCDHDMTVAPGMTLQTTSQDDPGPRPNESITPDPEWIER